MSFMFDWEREINMSKKKKMRFEFVTNRNTGMHCIRECESGKTSEWTVYRGIATLELDGECYMGVSAYFEGVLPIERVLRVEKV